MSGDTWEWDGEFWTQVADTGPSPRAGHELAFDSQRSRIVLFSGEAASGELRGDTWEWDGKNWTQLADFGPTACAASAMVFDGSEALLFGGIDSLDSANQSPRLFGATWAWNGEQWTQRQDIRPVPRWGHSAAFDSGRGRVLLFGGASAGPGDPVAADRVLGDTCETPGSGTPGSPGSRGPQLKTFTLDPETLPAGQTTTISVTLSDPAPADGVVVEIELTDWNDDVMAGSRFPLGAWPARPRLRGRSNGQSGKSVSPLGSAPACWGRR